MTNNSEEKMNKCKHLWVNIDGCLLCPANWKELNKEGFYFQAVNAPLHKESPCQKR